MHDKLSAQQYLQLIAWGWEVIEGDGQNITIQAPKDWDGSEVYFLESGTAELTLDVEDLLPTGRTHCPTCDGTGHVDEDHLDDGLVCDVFRDYCEAFDIHRAYGVEKWEERSKTVWIRQDVSARSCYNYTDHELPIEYFTRNLKRRAELLSAGAEARRQAEAEKKRQIRVAELRAAERRAEQLRAELEKGT